MKTALSKLFAVILAAAMLAGYGSVVYKAVQSKSVDVSSVVLALRGSRNCDGEPEEYLG